MSFVVNAREGEEKLAAYFINSSHDLRMENNIVLLN